MAEKSHMEAEKTAQRRPVPQNPFYSFPWNPILSTYDGVKNSEEPFRLPQYFYIYIFIYVYIYTILDVYIYNLKIYV